MYKKKGSLNLSVNAIVVFVLAFAMLGVGLFLTNMIKEQVGSGITSVVDINELKNPPSADNPLTISREVSVKRDKEIKLDVGYYNTGSDTAYDATIGIEDCILSGSVAETNQPEIISGSLEVAPGEGKAFRIKLDLGATGYNPGSYVCKMIVYYGGPSGTGELYESKQFFLDVTS